MGKIQQHYVVPIMTHTQIKQRAGTHFDSNHYRLMINQDADVYRMDANGKAQILFKFRTKVIQHNHSEMLFGLFHEGLKRRTSNRGAAGGQIDPQLISENVSKVINRNAIKSQVTYKNGTTSQYQVANRVHSFIGGFYDKPSINSAYPNYRGPCRMTAFTSKHLAQWSQFYPIVDQIDQLYQTLAPEIYQKQKQLSQTTPHFTINHSVFSTVTVNHNWRTACHIDKGDFKHGLTPILVNRRGTYTGCMLGYPQYGVCVDLGHGDVVLTDPHQYHCNTEMYPQDANYLRLSVIFYYRQNISKCIQVPNCESIHTQDDLQIKYRTLTTDMNVIKEIFVNKTYLKPSIGFIITAQQCWLDLGAHIGCFSLLCLKYGASVIAYEPEPTNYDLLVQNLSHNFADSTQTFQTHQKAVTSTPNDHGALYICNGLYNTYRHTLIHKKGRSAIQVECVSLNHILQLQTQINCIKMDIEGSEIALLEQTDFSLGQIQRLVFEYSFDFDRSIERFFRIITRLKQFFNHIHYTKPNPNQAVYKYYPPSEIVFCLK